MNKDYWNNEYWKKNLEKNKDKKLDFLDDLWINKYEDTVKNIPIGKALDLGCGLGQYTKYLIDRGFYTISADISIEALNKLKETINDAKTIQLDMSTPLPFENNSFDLVFANLSIHYFDEKTTQNLLQEIRRILKVDGYFIGSVNSSKGYEFIKDTAVEIEKNYYFNDKRNIRLWDMEQFDYFFKDFEKITLNEIRTTRWNRIKDMWEFIYKKVNK